jgi:4-amino-4-deoxy-L-arabinose transferase-like glycosyltransferase
MAKKAREKKPAKGAREAAGESGCDLEGPAPARAGTGWTGIVDTVRQSRSLQVLLLLLILGAILRLFQLGSASLWLDEATTLGSARRSLFEIWNFLSMNEFTPPLFFWMEHAMLTFGDSETVLRLVPALSGILTIPIFYAIGVELLDRKAGILAAALLTFSPFAIFYSQEARAYSTMLFFLSVAFYFFLRTRRTGARRDALLFGIFSSISLWTHLFASVPVVALFILGFGMKGREIQRDVRAALPMAISALAFVLLSLPLLLSALQIFTTLTGRGPSFGVMGPEIISLTLIQISGFSPILAWVLTLLFVIGIASLYPVSRGKALVLPFVLVFFLVMSVLLSYRMSMVPRYLTGLLMVFLPGIALTIRPACTLFRSRRLVYGALALVFLINLPALYGYYSTPQKDDWRGLAQEVTSVAAPGDLLIAIPGYIRQPLDYYYRNETRGTLEFGVTRVEEAEGVIGANPGRTVWFVVTGDIQSADPEGRMIPWLGEHSRVVWRDRNGGILLLRNTG